MQYQVSVSTNTDKDWHWHYYWIEGKERANRFVRRVLNLRTVVQAQLTGLTIGD